MKLAEIIASRVAGNLVERLLDLKLVRDVEEAERLVDELSPGIARVVSEMLAIPEEKRTMNQDHGQGSWRMRFQLPKESRG